MSIDNAIEAPAAVLTRVLQAMLPAAQAAEVQTERAVSALEQTGAGLSDMGAVSEATSNGINQAGDALEAIARCLEGLDADSVVAALDRASFAMVDIAAAVTRMSEAAQ